MARILIVDDQEVNRQLLVTLLGYRNHQLLEAGDGAEALQLARSERPDLIITDILMPTMDGYEFVRRLRDDPDTGSTVVIFYTAHYLKEEASELAASCGVAQILTKPCEPDLLLRTVEQLLRQPEKVGQAPAPADFHREHVRVITDKLSQTAEELGVANQKLNALIGIGLNLASEREPAKLLDKVSRAARELFGARYSMLAVGDKGDPSHVSFNVDGIDRGAVARIATPVLTEGTVGAAYRSREPRRLRQEKSRAESVGLPSGFPPVESMLVAPIMSIAQVYGWICLANKVGVDEFSGEDERLLAILAAQVGRIYENGSLYAAVEKHAAWLAVEVEQRREAQQKVERLNRVHVVLSGINTLIVRERDRQQLFDEACRIAVELGGFGIARIDLLDPERGSIRPTAYRTVDGPARGTPGTIGAPARGDDGLLERVISKKRPAWDNELSDETDRSAGVLQAIRLGYRSRVILPLIVEKQVAGCLSLLTREQDFFTDDELKLLRELADDISFAMTHIEKEEQLMYLAFYDSLTSLPNRELFLDRIDQHMHATDPVPAAVILLDLERFRMVNESLGSGAGDQLLRLVAGRLELTCGGKDALARVSANGFGALLRGVRSAGEIVHEIENRLLACFWDAYSVDGTELRVAAKAGIAMYPTDGSDAQALFRNAEAALKKAKVSGARYVFYSTELNARAAEVLGMETRLRKAVDEQQFVVHYQPKYDLKSREISGLEALIRWQDPKAGLVPPGKFISLLEETGLIVDVGRWVLWQVLHDYHDWASRAGTAPRIAVNVSAHELQQRDFLESVIEAVQRAGDIPEAIELEITESLMMQDLSRTVRTLSILRGLGITVAIDDFGTGYSSLSHIARLPIDKVKIDRSFVDGMVGNRQDLLIASTTIVLAHSLGLGVIAEGVETERQLDALERLGCDEVQGYLFSKPVPKAQIDAMLMPDS